MAKASWTDGVSDSVTGAAVSGASVTVFESDGITPATIYSDGAGTAKTNPFLSESNGKVSFYADPGIYVIQASKDGQTFTWSDEEIGMARRDNDLSDLDSAAVARSNLGLGSAATSDKTDSPTDTTAGRLLQTGHDITTLPNVGSIVSQDYEEGSWAPVVSGATIAGSYTPVVTQGRYIRIGSLIHVQGYVVWEFHTGTGAINISLPYASTAQAYSTASLGEVNSLTTLAAGDLPFAYAATSSAALTFAKKTQANPAAAEFLDVSASGAVMFSITHEIL